MVDGYEILVMAFVAPALPREWGIGPVRVGYLPLRRARTLPADRSSARPGSRENDDDNHDGVDEEVDRPVPRLSREVRTPGGGLRHRRVHALQDRVDGGHGEVTARDAVLDHGPEHRVVPTPELLDAGLLGRGEVLRCQEQPERGRVFADGDPDVLPDEGVQALRGRPRLAGRQPLEASGP